MCMKDTPCERKLTDATEQIATLNTRAEDLRERLDAACEVDRQLNQLLDTAQRECERLRGALADLVKVNEDHNEAIERVTGKPPGWNDSYLDAARQAAMGDGGGKNDEK